MCNWGKFLTKRYEEKKILFMKSQGQNKNWVLEAKAGCCTWPPALNTIKEWANHLSHPSSPTPGFTPPITPHK